MGSALAQVVSPKGICWETPGGQQPGASALSLGLHAGGEGFVRLSSKETGGFGLRWGLSLLHPVPSPGPWLGPESSGHVDGCQQFADVTCSEPGNKGGSSRWRTWLELHPHQSTPSPFSAWSVIFFWKPCWKI